MRDVVCWADSLTTEMTKLNLHRFSIQNKISMIFHTKRNCFKIYNLISSREFHAECLKRNFNEEFYFIYEALMKSLNESSYPGLTLQTAPRNLHRNLPHASRTSVALGSWNVALENVSTFMINKSRKIIFDEKQRKTFPRRIWFYCNLIRFALARLLRSFVFIFASRPSTEPFPLWFISTLPSPRSARTEFIRRERKAYWLGCSVPLFPLSLSSRISAILAWVKYYCAKKPFPTDAEAKSNREEKLRWSREHINFQMRLKIRKKIVYDWKSFHSCACLSGRIYCELTHPELEVIKFSNTLLFAQEEKEGNWLKSSWGKPGYVARSDHRRFKESWGKLASVIAGMSAVRVLRGFYDASECIIHEGFAPLSFRIPNDNIFLISTSLHNENWKLQILSNPSAIVYLLVLLSGEVGSCGKLRMKSKKICRK